MNWKNFYIYKDPYEVRYGLYFKWSPGVLIRFGILIGKGDFYYSETGPKQDHVREHFERLIDQSKSEAKHWRNAIALVQKERDELETTAAYESRI